MKHLHKVQHQPPEQEEKLVKFDCRQLPKENKMLMFT